LEPKRRVKESIKAPYSSGVELGKMGRPWTRKKLCVEEKGTEKRERETGDSETR